MLALYTTLTSANGRKVMAVSEHLGLTPEVRLINVYEGEGQTPEYIAINPTGKIPTLVDEKITLSESNAIMQYLAEAYGECRLYARDPVERAVVSSWLFWESAHWQPALFPVLSGFVGHKLRPAFVPAPSSPPDWNHEQLRPLLDRLETHLAGRTFLACDRVTIADFSVAGMMTYFRSADFPFSTFPNLAAWYGRVEALPAWRDTEVDLWS